MPEHEWFHVGNDGSDLAIYVCGDIPTDPGEFFNVINSVRAPERVELYINSLGGSLYTGFAVANRIADWQRAGVHVRAHVVGVAGSAAALIAAAADEVILQQDAFFLLHAPGYPDGREADAHAREMTSAMARRLSRKCGRSVDELQEMLAAGECWMNAEQAISAGFADTIVVGEG